MTTTEVIVPPGLTTATILYLRDGFADIVELDEGEQLVHGRVPNPRPARFVTVVRTGGFTRDRVVFNATHLFEAWGPDDDAASDLADQAYGLMHAITGRHHDVTFYGVDEIGGPANLPDLESDQARFVFTLAIRARSTAI